MVNHAVPFYENTSDNTHCFQACMKMILGFFLPEKEVTWEELDKASAKVEGKWTWPMAPLIWFAKNNFEVQNIEIFDYQKFSAMKEQYLFDFFGEEVANEQIKHSAIDQEVHFAKDFVEQVRSELRVPTKEDIEVLLRERFLVLCNVNSRALANRDGYAGHSVVVRGFDQEGFFLNDPGIPGRENVKVAFNTFEKAWAYPSESAKQLMAFRLR